MAQFEAFRLFSLSFELTLDYLIKSINFRKYFLEIQFSALTRVDYIVESVIAHHRNEIKRSTIELDLRSFVIGRLYRFCEIVILYIAFWWKLKHPSQQVYQSLDLIADLSSNRVITSRFIFLHSSSLHGIRFVEKYPTGKVYRSLSYVKCEENFHSSSVTFT